MTDIGQTKAKAAKPQPLERRDVVVHEPALSDDANAALTHDLLEVVGRSSVRVPADRRYANLGEGEDAHRSPGRAIFTESRFILGQVAAVLVVVGTIVALVTDAWWLLPVSVVVLGSGTAFVVWLVFSMTAAKERPSPSTVAMLEEEGVAHPERLFSDIVEEFTGNNAEDDDRAIGA